jgi:hypothetical protein
MSNESGTFAAGGSYPRRPRATPTTATDDALVRVAANLLAAFPSCSLTALAVALDVKPAHAARLVRAAGGFVDAEGQAYREKPPEVRPSLPRPTKSPVQAVPAVEAVALARADTEAPSAHVSSPGVGVAGGDSSARVPADDAVRGEGFASHLDMGRAMAHIARRKPTTKAPAPKPRPAAKPSPKPRPVSANLLLGQRAAVASRKALGEATRAGLLADVRAAGPGGVLVCDLRGPGRHRHTVRDHLRALAADGLVVLSGSTLARRAVAT